MTEHQDLENIRRARAEIMRISDPEDTATTALIALCGPLLTADFLTGRRELTASYLQEELAQAGREDPQLFASLRGLVQARMERWQARRGGIRVEQDMTWAKACGAWLCVPEDPDWPVALNDLAERMPFGLWGRGDRALLKHLNLATSQAIVGSRDVSSYGNSATSHLTGDSAAAGKTIVSGGAFGVDALAHRVALSTGASELPTVALMAGGLDRLYPRQNASLLENIIDRGLILGEVPLGQNPTRYRFLQRNRLIAALAYCTVVVEARWRSGALNTAHHALELGRPVYAVPGPIFSPSSEGCHRLIRDGLAQLITDATHLERGRLNLEAPEQASLLSESVDARKALIDSLTEIQGRVWDVLPVSSYRPVDAIGAESGIPARSVMLALTQMERLGLAQSQGNGWRKKFEQGHKHLGAKMG
ncbi:DNA-processing protein DprA [Rothia sp. P5766]|uniref:DNA-processing protein DprA n=1 Tax=unclassified Rothia (in: high G+C Gram-positive bacteria) TaxID=2689056 RepID=UPI003ACC2AE6